MTPKTSTGSLGMPNEWSPRPRDVIEQHLCEQAMADPEFEMSDREWNNWCNMKAGRITSIGPTKRRREEACRAQQTQSTTSPEAE